MNRHPDAQFAGEECVAGLWLLFPIKDPHHLRSYDLTG
jgi:hypothetical protein